MGEHLLCKQGVRGSTPLTSTTPAWAGAHALAYANAALAVRFFHNCMKLLTSEAGESAKLRHEVGLKVHSDDDPTGALPAG